MSNTMCIRGFRVTEQRHSGTMLIVCDRCSRCWAWPLQKPMSPGASLALRNHYASHEQDDDPPFEPTDNVD